MKTALRIAAAFVTAALVAAVIASLFSSQFVIAELQTLGVDVSIAQRFAMSLTDLSILQTLLLVISICFAIGFLVAAVCHRFWGGNRYFWYTLAGGCALLSTLLILSAVLQLMPIAGARSNSGLLCQAVAGALGGLTFARLTKPNNASSNLN